MAEPILFVYQNATFVPAMGVTAGSAACRRSTSAKSIISNSANTIVTEMGRDSLWLTSLAKRLTGATSSRIDRPRPRDMLSSNK
jgi:hypothetical protein